MKVRFGLAVAATALSVSLAASAQPGGGGGRGQRGGGMFGGGGGLMLLRSPEVQKELKMTPPQLEKLETAQATMQETIQKIMQDAGGPMAFRDMTPEDRTKFMAQMQAVQAKATSDLLDTTQQARLKQLSLQQEGPNALARKDVADQLKLTADQRKAIEDANRAAQEEQRGFFQGLQNATPEERQQAMAKMQTMRTATGAKLAALLSPDQKRVWDAMLGAKFTFPPQRGFGGPGGPGGGRRPGGAPPPPPV